MNIQKLKVTTGLSINRLRYSTSATKTELPASFADADFVERAPVRNKSGLLPQHRNVLFETNPYKEPHSWIHLTEKYQRGLYGKFGASSNVNPKICFGAKSQSQEKQQQDITQSESFHQMLAKFKATEAAKLEAIAEREDAIAKKLDKLDQWKADLNAKIAKREADAAAAIQRKERLIEEVRRHFGFKVDTRDERFKEMLEQKEKEDKRKQKEAKRKVKEEKMMAKLVKQTS